MTNRHTTNDHRRTTHDERPTTNDNALLVRGIAKRYGRLAALSDVSFTIRPGEVLGIIGPNGSGKTTLFECLGGALPSDAGTVLREGQPLSAAQQIDALFYLPDLVAPWPTRTVRWALAFVVGYWGRRADGITVENVIRRLELDPLLDSRIGALSKGQRKRALLAIGLLTPQPVLLADEPFEGLDLRQTREVARALRDFAAAGRTLVLSIHQIADAARVCDRFVLLSGGRTCGEGTLDELSALAADHGLGRRRDLEEIFLALT
jgi:ABC-type multidrug transport system ATPase subunit